MPSTPEEPQSTIDRREAVKRVTFMLGGMALVGSSTGLLAACAKDQPRDTATATGTTTFSAGDIATLDEVADTILPETAKSPGAKAAQTGAFMALMVTDTYTPDDQKIFRDGLAALDEASKKANGGAAFAAATPAQRTALLTALDKEQFDFQKSRKPGEAQHYFRMMKELTMLGFFTSEIGCTKALRYKESPGPFQPCVPYKAGDPAWAQHA
ncbi:MAG: gluconate 2-dehydrogenase subunit 3 family protein [Gemmatimonadaceae bacterium]|nr:gluconate 2-dehydrogenase subunit 3 family protein [Gemmatimonadaceae bacterium]